MNTSNHIGVEILVRVRYKVEDVEGHRESILDHYNVGGKRSVFLTITVEDVKKKDEGKVLRIPMNYIYYECLVAGDFARQVNIKELFKEISVAEEDKSELCEITEDEIRITLKSGTDLTIRISLKEPEYMIMGDTVEVMEERIIVGKITIRKAFIDGEEVDIQPDYSILVFALGSLEYHEVISALE